MATHLCAVGFKSDAKSHCCQTSEPRGVGQAGDRQCAGTSVKWMGGDCFYGEMAKKGVSRGAAPALGFVFIFMYLFSKLWGNSGGHLFMSPDLTQTPPPFSAGCPPQHLLPYGLSSLLKPASLRRGLETLGTDIQKLFTLESIPTTFYTSPCAPPGWCSPCATGATSDAPGWLQGVAQRDCTSVSVWPGLPTAFSKSEKPHRCCCLHDCQGPLGCTGRFW